MTLWLDVEDLFHFALQSPRLSGIQRLSVELYRGLREELGDGVRFCRHDPLGDALRTVPWEAVERLATGFHEPVALPPRAAATAQTPSTPGAAPRRGGALRALAGRLPIEIRDPLMRAAAAQRWAPRARRAVLGHGASALRAAPALLRGPTGRAEAAGLGEDIRALAAPGDVLGVLGAPWFHLDYAGFVRRATAGLGMRTALLVYDTIPIVRPEWFDAGLVRVFTHWFGDFAREVDHILAISAATARDVEAWARREGVALRNPVLPIPVGTGFSGPPAEAAPVLPAGLKPGYALVVSTIEARKNHLLAFRAWRRMLDEMPPERVPTLVFAGRIGWLVEDLMQQIENSGHLGGKLVLVLDPTDAELTALYRDCRFTLFPSLYEGWGLPVTESLSFGKLCLASDRTSVPEAGGPFCLYLDPENITGATDIIRRACTDDALIAEREAAIRDGFRPLPWRAAAAALADGLGLRPAA